METQHQTPQLAPPGAGLPWLELQFARGIFFAGLRATNYSRSVEMIVNERDKILAVLNPYQESELSKQVLIKRLRGMEDSSRFWSAYMTVEHLTIVNAGVAKTIDLLLRGERPDREASTAAVKPVAGVGPEVLARFTNSVEALLSHTPEGEDLKSEVRYSHPWFGPLEARGWLFMAGFHMRLHRRQLELILDQLMQFRRIGNKFP